LNEDTLLSIGQALEWDLEEPLRHLHGCARCQETLAGLRELNRVLDRRETVDPELTARVMTALEEEMAAEAFAAVPRRTPEADRWIRIVAAATMAFMTLAVAAAMQGAGTIAVWPALLLALLAGAAAAVAGERQLSAPASG
jgi:hypothetical protein